MHLNIVVGASGIVKIDIQPNTMPGNIVRHILLLIDVFNTGDLLLQQAFQEKPAHLGLPHDLSEHKIVRQWKLGQGRNRGRHFFALLCFFYYMLFSLILQGYLFSAAAMHNLSR